MHIRLLLGIGSLSLVACSSVGSATADGTVLGTEISPTTAFMVSESEIVISSRAGACGDSVNRSNSQNLVIDVAPIQVGTFPIDHATFQAFDETCNAAATTTTTGTVTVTAVDQSGALNIDGTVHGATGTYDLTFGSDHITGSFSAGDCSAQGPDATACR